MVFSSSLRGRVARGVALTAAASVLAACSPIRVVDRLTPDDTYAADAGVRYGGEPRQQLDVYRPLPSAMPVAGARPLIVFFYGGTWTTGERASYRFVGEALAAKGAVVVIPDYRLSPSVQYPSFVRDSARAVAWALDHAAELGADPRKVYVMGHSSGGYNAAMVALDARWLNETGASPTQLAGWIGLAGPYDFLPMGDPDAQRAFDWPNTPGDSQPIAHATAGTPRALLLAATRDRLVDPVRNSEQMAAKLRAAGVDVRLQTFDNLSHVTLVGALATRIRWIGGPVLPPILAFVGLSSDPSHKPPR
jgi:acetyl esterase/lipase